MLTIMRRRMTPARRLLSLAGCSAAVALIAGSAACRPAEPTAGSYLVAWTEDADREASDFLAVIDADRQSPGYGTVVASVPTGVTGTQPHHVEHAYTDGRSLFASSFGGNRMFRFGLDDPRHPQFLGEVHPPAELAYSHSFDRLPDGDVLATMQARDADDIGPGGLVRFHDDGSVVAWASGATASVVDAEVRPDSLTALPALDRIVSGSALMPLPRWHSMTQAAFAPVMAGSAPHNIQLWSLSGLKLLATASLEPPAGDFVPRPACFEDMARCSPNLFPMDPRALEDGKTVMIETVTCGLYRVRSLEPESFGADFVYRFDGAGCTVPLRIGHFWVQPAMYSARVLVLDLSDPSHHVEVSRHQFAEGATAPWLSYDERGHRIVVTHIGPAEQRIYLLDFDPATGAIALDEGFRDPGSDRPGVTFQRDAWPHGRTGPAVPHGTVFVR
ncbi:MAG: hypothetical protein E4H38_01455 [Gemmatimonadales bacterium]|nr:MAG: hypothetical protein E4H38_01455 [Gemmatimonadales bacterium]